MTTSAPTTILRTVDKPRLRVIGEPIPTPRRPPNEQLRPREFLTAQEEPAIFALSRTCIARGTGSSNPSPSSGESSELPTMSAANAPPVGLPCSRPRHRSVEPNGLPTPPCFCPLRNLDKNGIIVGDCRARNPMSLCLPSPVKAG